MKNLIFILVITCLLGSCQDNTAKVEAMELRINSLQASVDSLSLALEKQEDATKTVFKLIPMDPFFKDPWENFLKAVDGKWKDLPGDRHTKCLLNCAKLLSTQLKDCKEQFPPGAKRTACYQEKQRIHLECLAECSKGPSAFDPPSQ